MLIVAMGMVVCQKALIGHGLKSLMYNLWFTFSLPHPQLNTCVDRMFDPQDE